VQADRHTGKLEQRQQGRHCKSARDRLRDVVGGEKAHPVRKPRAEEYHEDGGDGGDANVEVEDHGQPLFVLLVTLGSFGCSLLAMRPPASVSRADNPVAQPDSA